jgi:hypothetical protein
VVLLLEPAHVVMERGMLLGIKRRAERAPVAPANAAGDPPIEPVEQRCEGGSP